ncbi:MAG TPA: hypothetical protein VNW46_06050 [Gemmatimonadaceae bacterium]|nr:hypothetical protein [Gemmatimonadaceae bacterium]
MADYTVRATRRAPALVLSGRPGDEGAEGAFRFRIPFPPVPTLGVYAAHAVERRAKKVYFAVLDAMRTGTVDPAARARLARLIAEAKPRADDVLRHLMRVLDAVARHARETGRPLMPQPPAPLTELSVEFIATSAPAVGRSAANAVSEVLQWPLEWLQTRGVAVQKGVQVYCGDRVEVRR